MLRCGYRCVTERGMRNMADESNDYVKREDFIALCEQVARLAAEVEKRDRFENPEGPNGWRLRKPTVIKNKVNEIRQEQQALSDPDKGTAQGEDQGA